MRTDRDIEEKQLGSEKEMHLFEIPASTRKEQSGFSPALKHLVQQYESIEDPEKQIVHLLEFMRGVLSQSGSSKLKDFWQARRLCLSFFQKKVVGKNREKLWEEYVELSREGCLLKTALEEQSSFTVEQIELAIRALEQDLEHYEELLTQTAVIEFPETSVIFQRRKGDYNKLQRELHVLNTLASRVNSLRKEVIKTEMRVRQKTGFFERLSKSGNLIFPRRKELIQTVSVEFLMEVENFIQNAFHDDIRKMLPLYLIKEEVKALQAIAKMLTLNTHSFTETRLRLSECWDRLRHLDKERKKEMAERKILFRENYDLALLKIKAFAEEARSTFLSHAALERGFDEIRAFMSTLSLGREEMFSLREECKYLRQMVVERMKEKETLLPRD